MEIETSAGVYSTPEEDSYSINFAIDAINHIYPGCTGMYLDVAGHMLAFYVKKTNPRAGLLHNQGVIVNKAIANIPTWMGYLTRWKVQCVSVSEASEILAGCKRLEKNTGGEPTGIYSTGSPLCSCILPSLPPLDCSNHGPPRCWL